MLKLRNALLSSKAAIDLASIMVGVIVIGLIGGVISATIFAVIPWAQDNAAKHQLQSIHTAQNAFYGLSATPDYKLINGENNTFGYSADLALNNLLIESPNQPIKYCTEVVSDSKGQDYAGYSKSDSGRIFVSYNSAKTPKVITGTDLGSCLGPIVDGKVVEDDGSGSLPGLPGTGGGSTGGDNGGDTGGGTTPGDGSGGTGGTGGDTTTPGGGTTPPVDNPGGNGDGGVPGVPGSGPGGTTPVFYGETSFTINCPVGTVGAVPVEQGDGMLTWSDGYSQKLYMNGYAPTNRNLVPGVTYTATFKGTFLMMTSEDMTQTQKNCLRSMDSWGTNSRTFSAGAAFRDMPNFVGVPRSIPSTVLYLNSIFENAPAFNDPDVSNWDVTNVTTLLGTFKGATSFNQPIQHWNTKNVTIMDFMFQNSGFNQPMANWDFTGTKKISGLFAGSPFNQPINNWDVSHLTHFGSLFYQSTAFNQPLDKWNMSNAQVIGGMFYQAKAFNQPINSWNVGNVTGIDYLFAENSTFNQPLNNWDTKNVKTMISAFNKNTGFQQDLTSWNVSGVTDHRFFADYSTFPTNLHPKWVR